VRLDKFLKSCRAIKRRAWAKEACEAGAVVLNGRSGKAHAEVRAGDRVVVDVDGAGKFVEIAVLGIPERGEEKPEHYEIVRSWVRPAGGDA
jgi:ribosomal 50S subunit-recycling heat shock protein